MSLILSGTDGLSDVDGSAATPAIRGTDANTGIFFPAADTIAFAEGGAEVARFDSSGNLGLGVTPSAWRSTTKAIQLGQAGVISASTNQNLTAVAMNDYVDSGGTERYINTGFASLYQQVSGQHQFYTAASGTAGNAISFTQVLGVNTSGAIGVGSSPSYGTSGQVLTSGGSGAAPSWTTPAGGFTAMTVLTSSTTFTIPAGKTTLKITVVGGGGGGGFGTVAAGTTGGNSSVASGTQSITTITGGGGVRGNISTYAGGAGGVGSGGDLNFYGGDGGGSSNNSGGSATQQSGQGGSSFLGGGGYCVGDSSTTSGGAGRVYGGGGGATYGGNGGGAGGTAIKYFTGLTPGNTLTVTIGTGGSGGNGGPAQGGAGAAGVVVIEY